mmetsp:Transcript_11170/g.41747  ORF Transcript_11170/g.41747 Transcript_11170/m.41747 type:complete len:349 (-) Transcript_11170:569-1615(-)
MSVCGEKSAWKCEVRSGEVFCVENLTSFQKSKMTACSSFSEFHQHTSFHFQPFLNNPSISKLKSLFESSSTQLSHLLNSHASPTSGKYLLHCIIFLKNCSEKEKIAYFEVLEQEMREVRSNSLKIDRKENEGEFAAGGQVGGAEVTSSATSKLVHRPEEKETNSSASVESQEGKSGSHFHIIDWNIPDRRSQCTPLHFACRESLPLIVQYLLSKPTLKINVPDKDSYFPLHYACLNNKDAGIVRMLLAHEAKCFVQDDDGMTPLHRACENGASLEMVELLLEHDASAEFLNAQNVNGWSALHLASYNQIRSICELLLKKGANTDLRTKAGKAAVFWGLGITHNHAAPF